jgi:hypothetical protein
MEKIKNYLMNLCSKDRSYFLLTLLRTALELIYLVLLLLAFFTVRGGTEPNYFNIFDFVQGGNLYFLISIGYIFVYPILLVLHNKVLVKPLTIVRFGFHVILVLFILLTFSGVKDLLPGEFKLSFGFSFFLLLLWIGVLFFSAFKPEILSTCINRFVPTNFLSDKTTSQPQDFTSKPETVVEAEQRTKPVIDDDPLAKFDKR